VKILLPVDGSTASLDAVRHALALVEEGLDATFVLANVQEPATLYELMLTRDADVLEQVAEGAGEHALQEAQSLLQSAGVAFDSEIDSGDARSVLLEIAEREGCDAIIMGARGLGHVRGTLLGSVSHSILHHATIPVTIVHEQPGDEDEGS
jgi:nucleotide-binding universal stress UspA family protein